MDLLVHAAVLREDAAAEILTGFAHAPRSPPDDEDDERSSGGTEMPEPMLDEETIVPWSQAEDDLLRRISATKPLVYGQGRRGAQTPSIWQEVAQQFAGRSPAECMHRWRSVLCAENVKGPWSPSEDSQLMDLVNQYGGKHWAHIASMLPGRTGKQCRERCRFG